MLQNGFKNRGNFFKYIARRGRGGLREREMEKDAVCGQWRKAASVHYRKDERNKGAIC